MNNFISKALQYFVCAIVFIYSLIVYGLIILFTIFTVFCIYALPVALAILLFCVAFNLL